MRLSSILACVATAPMLVAASEPVRLQPASPWVVDYAENSCRLVRMFGDARRPVKLAFESEAPGSMDMLAVGRPLQSEDKEVAASFDPIGITADAGKVVQTVDHGDPAILWSHIALQPKSSADDDKAREHYYTMAHVRPPAVSLAEQAARQALRQEIAQRTTSVAIATHRNHSVVLETGSLGDAIKAFDQCGRDSLKDWGVDPAVEARIVRPVWTTNAGQWLVASDYPRAAASRGEQSEVAVRVLVDATGRVTRCVSLSHFASEDFKRVSCAKITERARFEPAELADGTKVPSYFIQQVTYRLAP